MKPIFTVHAGEFVVAEYIERKFPYLNVWIPSKDTGIDLLVTDKQNTKAVSLQIKFSKDFSVADELSTSTKATGWWKLDSNKLESSKADFWVFVLYCFESRNYDFVVIRPAEILSRFNFLGRSGKNIHCYLRVTSDSKCWDTRGLGKQDLLHIENNTFSDHSRDLSPFLNNWNLVLQQLQNEIT